MIVITPTTPPALSPARGVGPRPAVVPGPGPAHVLSGYEGFAAATVVARESLANASAASQHMPPQHPATEAMLEAMHDTMVAQQTQIENLVRSVAALTRQVAAAMKAPAQVQQISQRVAQLGQAVMGTTKQFAQAHTELAGALQQIHTDASKAFSLVDARIQQNSSDIRALSGGSQAGQETFTPRVTALMTTTSVDQSGDQNAAAESDGAHIPEVLDDEDDQGDSERYATDDGDGQGAGEGDGGLDGLEQLGAFADDDDFDVMG
jgi:hypothetical protein